MNARWEGVGRRLRGALPSAGAAAVHTPNPTAPASFQMLPSTADQHLTPGHMPSSTLEPDPAGLYVHVPFCLTRCGYCDFNTYAGLDHLAGAYVRALAKEAALAAPAWTGVPFASIFLGGGTPTMLPAGAIRSLLRTFPGRFAVEARAEVT